MNQSSTKKTLPAFTSQNAVYIKGIAIIMMIIHHCFLSPERYKGQTLVFLLPERYLNYIALFFKICVCLFVFISAYGITLKLKSLEDVSLSRLMPSVVVPRLIKLLANFMFVFLLVHLFGLFYDPGRFAKIYGTEFPEAIGYYVLDLFGLAQLFGTPTYLATYWYYSLAILIVCLVPVFFKIMRKTGTAYFLVIVAIITFTISIPNQNIWQYILCIATGTACAYEDIVNKWLRFSFGDASLKNNVLKFMLEALSLFLLMWFRESALKKSLVPVWDSLIPMVLICFCCEFIFILPILPKILGILGKHSINIFLVHNYIRIMWFYDYTYSYKYPIIIAVVLLVESLILSLIIETLKKVIHFYKHLDSFIIYMEKVFGKRTEHI